MARLIQKDVHGVFAILNAMLMFSTFICESGVGAAIVQRKEYNSAHFSSALYLSFFVSAILFFTLFLTSEEIAAFYEFRFSAILVQAISTNLLLGTFKIIPRSLLIRDLAFRELLIVNVGGLFVGRVAVGITLAWLGHGIWAFILGELSMNLVMGLVATWFRPYPIWFKVRKKELREIAGFGAAFTMVRLLSFATAQLDKLILGKLISTSEIAIFEKSQFATNLPRKVVGDSLDPVLFSMLSKRQHDTEFVADKYFGFLTLAICIGLYTVTFIASLNSQLISLVLGSEWQDCQEVIAVLVFSIPLFILIRFSDIIARVKNRMAYSIAIKAVFIGCLVAIVFLGYRKGLFTLAIYYMMGLALYSFLMFALALHLVDSRGIRLLQGVWQSKWLVAYCIAKGFLNLWLARWIDYDFLTVLIAISFDLFVFFSFWTSKIAFFGESNVATIREFLRPVAREL